MTSTTTKGQWAGIFVSIFLALGVTALAADHGWSWALSEWDGWPVLSIAVVVGAWVNVAAWMLQLWPLAIIGSLLTFVAPWGFIYPGIIAGPILAIAAGIGWTRRDRPPTERTS